MLVTAIIAFREFLEAFLIIGIFLGISKKLQLRKELEIILAASIGLIFSFVLSIGAFLLSNFSHTLLTEKNIDYVESYILIFSGVFIVYVILSLHKTLQKNRKEMLEKANSKVQKEVFDLSLFLTIVFMVIREGFEIALFTTSVSVFSAFIQNLIGLFLGFVLSFIAAFCAFFIYIKFPIEKVFKFTEYIIILLGASLVQNGITKLFQTHFSIYLSKTIPLPLRFLPAEDSISGHLLQSLFGVDREFSLVRLAIMLSYIIMVYVLFLRKQNQEVESRSI